MGLRRLETRLGFCILALAIAAGPAAGQSAPESAGCKRKSAGFFLLYKRQADGPVLRQDLQAIPASLTGAPGDPERGRSILLNKDRGDCLSCHQLSQAGSPEDQGALGPSLDGVGNKYTEGQLRQILVNPKVYFTANTIMPTYLSATNDLGKPVLVPSEIEDLIAFLKTLK